MKHLFLSYELSKILKEKGFNEPCLAMYTNKYTNGLEYPVAIHQHEGSGISGDKNSEFEGSKFEYTTAPTHQQVTDWLMQVHKIYISLKVDEMYLTYPEPKYWFRAMICKYFPNMGSRCVGCVGEYYLVLNETIKEALTLVVKK